MNQVYGYDDIAVIYGSPRNFCGLQVLIVMPHPDAASPHLAKVQSFAVMGDPGSKAGMTYNLKDAHLRSLKTEIT